MLIHFDDLFKRYNVQAEGVLHIGANVGEELPFYYRNGIKRSIWVEANPEIYDTLLNNTNQYPDAWAYNECIGEKDGEDVVFHVSNNAGQSSSMLELGTHVVAHREVHYIKDIHCKTKRIDTLLKESGFIPGKFTFLNIDLQGAELSALKSMGSILRGIQYAYLEVNKEHLYVGCPLVEDIDAYLFQYGFRRVETYWAGNTGWGDAFYINVTNTTCDAWI